MAMADVADHDVVGVAQRDGGRPVGVDLDHREVVVEVSRPTIFAGYALAVGERAP